MEGKKVISAVMIPNAPTVDLITFMQACTEPNASYKAPPTMGTKLLTTNFVAFMVTVSALTETSD